MALPMPWAPPVTKALLLLSFMIECLGRLKKRDQDAPGKGPNTGLCLV